jgi:hypothetical protein
MYSNIQDSVETALLLGGMTRQELYDMYGVTRHEWIKTLEGKVLNESRFKLRARLVKDARESAALLSSVLKRAK